MTPLNIPPERLQRIRAYQIDEMFENLSIGLFGALGAAVILYAFIIHEGLASTPIMTGWLAVMVIQTALRVALVKAYHRRKPPPDKREVWHTTFTISALVGGLCWGIGSLLMVRPDHFDVQLLVAIVICALVYASLSGFGSYQPFYALLFPAMLPLVIWSLFHPDARHLAYAGLGIVWIPITAQLGYSHSQTVIRTLNLRYENLDLMEDLQVQKTLAEQANIAKSRFLASASHDLRQPVHALGMFVGALKAHDMTPPAQRLLGHVESSVEALDGLFTALLDISRLDAGAIPLNIVSFPLQPILERVCSDFGPELQAKDLTLSLVPSAVIVESDPILLERILRNLVSNAVRHIRTGHILVGCRWGNPVRVQVWDTGPGIADAQRERIFEEFYQIDNSGRDRSQGLGLGLAIVRRLTAMLDHPLRLATREGHGTLFEISVPRGQSENLAAPVLMLPPRPGQGLILVVDDEAAIRDAMRSLLESWGYGVITAASGPEMLAHMAHIANPPRLIISDYRLQNGEDGIGVIRRLQSEFNDDIPAMLVTGDTAPDRLLDSQASGFLLLHKPLSADRLRAAIQALV